MSLLARRTFLVSAGSRVDDPFDSWIDWMPEAAFLHFATKDVRYVDADMMRQKLVRKTRIAPPPSPTKRYRGARRTALPPADDRSSLASILRERRTWRQFDARARLSLSDTATLLGLTWGVQRWAHTNVGTVALKTSPSGGARHPIEVYLLARRVEGLTRGWYHYDADAHALELVADGRKAASPLTYLPEQTAYRAVNAVFVMSVMFGRTQWAYRTPRAYRVVLLDAGHLGQTFCLVATALGLAPFCSAALADRRTEADLGLDGVRESVVYACGVGIRPAGVEWAPWPTVAPLPRLTAPRWQASRRKQPSR